MSKMQVSACIKLLNQMYAVLKRNQNVSRNLELMSELLTDSEKKQVHSHLALLEAELDKRESDFRVNKSKRKKD